jgi:uncharacterized protein YjbJ (UPF0337 family)
MLCKVKSQLLRAVNHDSRLHMWNKNERYGKIDQAKGKVKQAVGDLTHDDDLKAEGQVDEAVGKVEAAVGQTRRKAGEAIESLGKTVSR